VVGKRVSRIPASLERLNNEIQGTTGELPEKIEEFANAEGSPAPPSPEACSTNGKAGKGWLEPLQRALRMFTPSNIIQSAKGFCSSCVGFIKDPHWSYVENNVVPGTVEDRLERFGATHEDVVVHKAETMQHVMGASCLVFLTPSLLAGYLALSGRADHCAVPVFFLCAWLAYVSVVAFHADYWYTGDTAKSESGESYRVDEWRKQYICNAIDLSNVPICGAISLGFGIIQYFYAPTRNWLYPLVVFLGFGAGGAIQQMSLKYYRSFTEKAHDPEYDPQNPSPEATQDLKTGQWMCIGWHILAVSPPLVQIYGLLVDGVNMPLSHLLAAGSIPLLLLSVFYFRDAIRRMCTCTK